MPKVCSDFLGKPIKHHAVSESCTESVFEKALVSREIALQCIQRPRDFEEWARQSRIDFFNPFNEKRPYYKMNSQNEENDRKKVKKTGNMDTNPGKDKSTGPVSDENRATTTFSQGYEAGYQAAYQAGFQSGFQMGYEQGVGKANPQESQEKIDKPDESQHENQHECHESMHYTDEEGSVDDQMETLSQESGGLLAHLMKDDRVREIVQRTNEIDNQEAFPATEVQGTKSEALSRGARIQAKLEALESRNKVPENQSPKEEGGNSWKNIMDW
ncbi:hypothetical protein TrVFT333_011638 [Trichoderma virens FT-333]|nr:hypothetical protein TrVFT333_011638 [Trichoderma virens FT-333]